MKSARLKTAKTYAPHSVPPDNGQDFGRAAVPKKAQDGAKSRATVSIDEKTMDTSAMRPERLNVVIHSRLRGRGMGFAGVVIVPRGVGAKRVQNEMIRTIYTPRKKIHRSGARPFGTLTTFFLFLFLGPQVSTTKGTGGDILILEEAAYVDPGFFYETVAPLLIMGNTTLLAISTLTSEINFYSRLLRMRDKVTQLPVFTFLSVQLACAACKAEGKVIDCVHMLHLVPRRASLPSFPAF